MEHYSHPLDLSVSEMHMKMVGHTNPESHHFYSTMPISSNTTIDTTMTPKKTLGHTESSGGSIGPDLTDQQGSENLPFPVKRKAEVGHPQQLTLPNKRPAHVGANVSFVGFLHPSAPQRKTASAQSNPDSPGMRAQHSQNKKMVRNDSMSGKSGLQIGQSAKRQTAQIESASKEPYEAVRSKMRENLAGALALAFQKQDVSKTDKNQSEATIILQPIDSWASEPNSTVGGNVPVSGTETSKESFFAEIPSGNSGQDFQGFQYTSILPDEDVPFGGSFFGKDDLLHGNGLSWAFDFDAQTGDGKEAHHDEKPNPAKEEAHGREEKLAVLSPENLAFKIESELFKLFGDVNKKYREKGRSLLFNLKDRNNPDLRESVMSGGISPEKLCSMSAEELASKELSQWRMAKAEELAQMVVLPDTEVGVRRFVKKTHKGEYQVEVDHDDSISAEVPSGTSMLLTRTQPEKETVSPHSPSMANLEDKGRVAGLGSSSLEDQDFPGSLIIPADGTDLMQGLIVDELKDAEFLPPIISLDEFMESLNNEPPFENLSGDALQKIPTPHVGSPNLVRNTPATNRDSDSPRDGSSKKGGVFKKPDAPMKLSGSPAKQNDRPNVLPNVEYNWDGTLQLSLSSSITVGGLYRSGEKTSMKEWLTSLEIKGRVRLDAFEKFLQELPMSRTRAVMVLEFVLKDMSSESERAHLSEAVSSYISDERLGYAEPAPGIELYLCPPTSRISDILNKLIVVPKENSEIISSNTSDNGLIAVVVWRRTSSHHAHVPKKQQTFAPLPPPKRMQDSLNVNVNPPLSKTTTHTPVFNNRIEPEQEEDDDDIPPGFGPGSAVKDDDDLPEFNFSGNLNLNTRFVQMRSPQNLGIGGNKNLLPVDQAREMIKKYGHGGNSLVSRSRLDDMNMGIEPWKDDEDDDIPEWRPQGQPQLPSYARAAIHGHRPHLVTNSQHRATIVARQPPGGRWVQPPGPLRGPRWRQC
ncbi:hypothetical protein OROGR_005876 [Orobanche gracilis]